MYKRSFVGLKKPRLEYTDLEATPSEAKTIPLPKQLTFLMDLKMETKELAVLKKGDTVQTGQKLFPERPLPCVLPVSGTVAGVSPYTGDFGRSMTSVTIDRADAEDLGEGAGAIGKEISLKDAVASFELIPGAPCLKRMADPEKPIHTVVVLGADSDLLVMTNQFVLHSRTGAVKNGILALKKIAGIDNIILVAPPNLMGKASETEAEVRPLGREFPSALPRAVMKDVLNQVVPAGKAPEDLGVCFMSAEAVASIGDAVETGRLPIRKTVTVIKKDGSRQFVTAAIGTPVSDIFNACGIVTKDRDRILIGGPLTGSAIYSEDHPVCPDTDAIIVQDSEAIPLVSDYPCVNCGECVRICPARMPVNDLVRYLEAGRYEDGAANYDLYSCFGCGLCSFVCISRIPIFQYIQLAQYELNRVKAAEESNV
jgi:electron transport complex protein RnfC